MPDEGTRERLLDAAWSVAAERGVDELTLASVAARAGVTRQAVYLHFGNRSTLLVAMAKRFDRTSGFRRRLAAARAAAPRPALRRVLDAWFAYVPKILPVHRSLEAAALTGGVGADAYRDRMEEWRAALRIDVRDWLMPDCSRGAGTWSAPPTGSGRRCTRRRSTISSRGEAGARPPRRGRSSRPSNASCSPMPRVRRHVPALPDHERDLVPARVGELYGGGG